MRLDDLKSLLTINKEKKRLELNRKVLGQVGSIVKDTDKLLYKQIESKFNKYNTFKSLMKDITHVEMIHLVLLVLIGALNNKSKIPETVFKIHLLNFISKFMLKEYEDDLEIHEINMLLLRVIDNSIPIKSIGENRLDKKEKDIFRCITIILKELEKNE